MSARSIPEGDESRIWVVGDIREPFLSGALIERVGQERLKGISISASQPSWISSPSHRCINLLRPMSQAGWPAEKTFRSLLISDSRRISETLIPLYERTMGDAGYLSIPLPPGGLQDIESALEVIQGLWTSINRPNLMIRIPCTPLGIEVFYRTILLGLSAHITLVSSLQHYEEIVQAYIKALEERLNSGEHITHVASFVSIHLEAVNQSVDLWLEGIARKGGRQSRRADSLKGTAAGALGEMIFAQFQYNFEGEGFMPILDRGGRPQQILWEAYPKEGTSSRDELLAGLVHHPDTFITLSLGDLAEGLPVYQRKSNGDILLAAARAQNQALANLGFSPEEAAKHLVDSVLSEDEDSASQCLFEIEMCGKEFVQELGDLIEPLRTALGRLDEDFVVERLWRRDTTLWELDRLGNRDLESWFHFFLIPGTIGDLVEAVSVESLSRIQEHFQRYIYVGPGPARSALRILQQASGRGEPGSFLFFSPNQGLEVLTAIQDSYPEQVMVILDIDPIQSKAAVKILEDLIEFMRELGFEEPAANLFAITLPDSSLAKGAAELRGITVIELPAAPHYPYDLPARIMLSGTLLGLPMGEFVEGMLGMADQCEPGTSAVLNPGAFLGASISAAVEKGSNWILPYGQDGHAAQDSFLRSMAGVFWVGSSGSLLPMQDWGTPPGSRWLLLEGEPLSRSHVEENPSVPVLKLSGPAQPSRVGEEMFRWFFATWVFRYLQGLPPSTGLNPVVFPLVDAKLEKRLRKGSIATDSPIWDSDGIQLWGWGNLPVITAEKTLVEITRSGLWTQDGIPSLLIVPFSSIPESSLVVYRQLVEQNPLQGERSAALLHAVEFLEFGLGYALSEGDPVAVVLITVESVEGQRDYPFPWARPMGEFIPVVAYDMLVNAGVRVMGFQVGQAEQMADVLSAIVESLPASKR